MTVYQAGHVRRNPETKAVAVRTHFSEVDFPDMAWLIATVGMGALTKPSSAVEGEPWIDLYVPEENTNA